jgi:hypothetical protein
VRKKRRASSRTPTSTEEEETQPHKRIDSRAAFATPDSIMDECPAFDNS